MYDVLVIGAGPAGCAAAYHASRAGLRVLIVDRQTFPRPKTCGDALTARALAAVERMGLSNLPGWIVNRVRVVRQGNADYHDELATHQPPGYGLVLPRQQLDALLLEQARQAGAEFRVARAEALTAHRGKIAGAVLRTETGSQRIRCQTVVAATGAGTASSLLGACSRGDRPVWGIAGRCYLRLRGSAGHELEVHMPIVNRGQILSGYGWVFPVSDECVNVGVGVFRTAKSGTVPLSHLIEAFVASLGERNPRYRSAERISPTTSAAISITPTIEGVAGLLPVGDLAGLANPFTGEGIATALESGEMAAKAIVSHGDNALAGYHATVRAVLPRHFSLRSVVPAVHGHPFPLLGRGIDVIASNQGPSAQALRRLLWDFPPLPVQASSAPCRPLEDIVRAVADAMARGGHGVRPMLAQLVPYLLAQPGSGFGSLAALGAAVHLGLGDEKARLGRDRLSVLVVLELANLVLTLHRELPQRDEGRGSMVGWGGKTFNVVIADNLTAHALRRCYNLDAVWTQQLGSALRRMFRHAASAGSCSPRPADLADLFILAARAGMPDGWQSPVPQAVRKVAAVLARDHGLDGGLEDRFAHVRADLDVCDDRLHRMLGLALELVAERKLLRTIAPSHPQTETPTKQAS